jgi:hypothetical protein
MITPPATVASFYTVLFERPGAQELMKIIAPLKGTDIEQVLITSLDIGTDLQAMEELQRSVTIVMEQVGEPYDNTVTFNPLYLPMDSATLEEKLEVDTEGTIVSVDGFTNPFIAMSLQIASESCPDVVDAKVCYKQFMLPPYNEILTEATVS